MARITAKTARSLGRRGGKATAKTHGKDYMRSIGRKGFLATVARHWQGDKAGFIAWLHARAALAVGDALASLILARRLEESPGGIASVEIPSIDFEDYPY